MHHRRQRGRHRHLLRVRDRRPHQLDSASPASTTTAPAAASPTTASRTAPSRASGATQRRRGGGARATTSSAPSPTPGSRARSSSGRPGWDGGPDDSVHRDQGRRYPDRHPADRGRWAARLPPAPTRSTPAPSRSPRWAGHHYDSTLACFNDNGAGGGIANDGIKDGTEPASAPTPATRGGGQGRRRRLHLHQHPRPGLDRAEEDLGRDGGPDDLTSAPRPAAPGRHPAHRGQRRRR